MVTAANIESPAELTRKPTKSELTKVSTRIASAREDILINGGWASVLREEIGCAATAREICKTKDPEKYQKIRTALLSVLGTHELVNTVLKNNPKIVSLSKKDFGAYERTLRKNAKMWKPVVDENPILWAKVADPQKLKSLLTQEVASKNFDKKLNNYLKKAQEYGWHPEALLLVLAKGFREKGNTFYVSGNAITSGGLFKTRLPKTFNNYGALKNSILTPIIDKLKKAGVLPTSKSALSLNITSNPKDSAETVFLKGFIGWIIDPENSEKLLNHPTCKEAANLRLAPKVKKKDSEKPDARGTSEDHPQQPIEALEQDRKESTSPTDLKKLQQDLTQIELTPKQFKKKLDKAKSDYKVIELLKDGNHPLSYADKSSKDLIAFFEDMSLTYQDRPYPLIPLYTLEPTDAKELTQFLLTVSNDTIKDRELDSITAESIRCLHSVAAYRPGVAQELTSEITKRTDYRLLACSVLVHNLYKLSKHGCSQKDAQMIAEALAQYLEKKFTLADCSKEFPEFTYENIWEDIVSELLEQVRGNSGLFFDAFVRLVDRGCKFSEVVAEAALE